MFRKLFRNRYKAFQKEGCNTSHLSQTGLGIINFHEQFPPFGGFSPCSNPFYFRKGPEGRPGKD